jgi:hypothetical protein
VIEDFDCNEQRTPVTRQGIMQVFPCCEETPTEKKRYLSRQNSVLGFVKSSLPTRASPRVLLGIGDDHLDQCFSTAGSRPGTGPWHQLFRAARGSPGICHFRFLSIFHE